MALTNAYATVAEVRAQFKDEGARLDSALLERAINAASRAVDRHCGRRFWRDASVTTRTFIAADATLLFLMDEGTCWDISTRTGLVVSTGTDGVSFDTTLTSSQYLLEPRNADVVAGGDTADAHAFWMIRAINGYRWSTANLDTPTVQVVARFGWSAVPEPIKQATILKASALFKRKDAPFGVAGMGEWGAVRITRSDPDVLDLLAPFELAGFA